MVFAFKFAFLKRKKDRKTIEDDKITPEDED